jgi:lambda family phage portal protein
MSAHNCRVGRQRPLSRRQYAAAKVTRLTGDWMPLSQNVNEIIRTSAPMLRGRIRQLVRDFPYFARAVDVLVDYTVGTGMSFQSRVLNPRWTPGSKTEKKIDRVTCQKVEDAVAWAMDEADAAGRLHFHELEQLGKRQDVEAGEFLFVKTAIKDPKRYLPFALQAYEADWLTDLHAVTVGGNKIEQGREYDPLTGRIVAYHFADPWGWGKPKRIPAEYVLHGFRTLRPGQLAGVSPFAAAVLIAHDLNDYLDATIDTAKLAAKYLALVTTEDPETWQANREAEDSTDENGARRRIETLENAIIDYLRPGEDVKFPQNNSIGGTFEPFVKFVLQMLAIATNTPYSLLSGNHAGYNYTGLRGERQDMLKMFAPHQRRHVRQLTAPFVHEVIDQAVFAGKLSLPGYFQNPRVYQRGLYLPPGTEPIDPLRESKANRDDIAAGLRSPQEIAARRGRDIEEVLDELQEFQEMCAERGIVLIQGSTSLANNPAAIDGGEEGEGEEGDERVVKSSKAAAASDPEAIRKKIDAYGIGVRAGTITPQLADEEMFRREAGLPEPSQEVKDAWESDGGVRRPVTLKAGDAFEAETEQITGESGEE